MYLLFVYVFTIHFTMHYALFTMHYVLCTMYYALCIIYYALCIVYYLYVFICIHYFIRIHTYSLFHVTKSRDFGTHAYLSSRRVTLHIGPKSIDH